MLRGAVFSWTQCITGKYVSTTYVTKIATQVKRIASILTSVLGFVPHVDFGSCRVRPAPFPSQSS